MTDRELLAQLAAQLEELRTMALADGKISRNGIRLPKWRVVAEACRDMRVTVLNQLAEEEAP